MNTRLQRVERVLLLIGLLAVVVYGANLLYSRFYQAYAHWSFDQSLQGKTASGEGFLAHLAHVETTKHPGSSGPRVEPARDSRPAPVLTEEAPNTHEWAAGRVRAHQQSLSSGAPPPIGRLQIPAIDLSVIVLEGTDGWTLNRAVGHIEGTALPWEPGNSGLAGHRDGFFRGLEKISKNDRIVLTTLKGTYHYRVDGIEIVNPADIGVLDASPHPTLTLVTCYPFHFVGSAPKRFIVRAALLQGQRATGVHTPTTLTWKCGRHMTWNDSRALLGKKRERDFRRGGNMSDFYQSGVVATLHRLGRADGHKIESELEAFSKQRLLRWFAPCVV